MDKTTKILIEKLHNHQKLLSLVSEKILPIKTVLLQDIKEMIETASIKEKKV